MLRIELADLIDHAKLRHFSMRSDLRHLISGQLRGLIGRQLGLLRRTHANQNATRDA